MKNDNIVSIFECCRIIEGYNKSIIYDYQRGKIYDVPKSISHVLKLLSKHSYSELKKIIRNDDEIKIINEYIEFLLKEEICFYIHKKETNFFPKLDVKWQTPNHINILNLVILNDKNSIKSGKTLCDLINKLKSRVVLIEFKFEHLNNILPLINYLTNSVTQSFQLKIFNSTIKITPSEVETIVSNLGPKVEKIYFMQNYIEDEISLDGRKIYFVLNNPLLKTTLYTPKLQYSFENYLESSKNNLFYNSRLTIVDDSKNINLLINTNDEQINKFISKRLLDEFWHVSKNKVLVCKDCEFNRFCIDQRKPKKTKNGAFIYDSECSYNPYIAKWSHEEGYRTLAECGVVSNEEEFSIDHERIAKINEALWGEE